MPEHFEQKSSCWGGVRVEMAQGFDATTMLVNAKYRGPDRKLLLQANRRLDGPMARCCLVIRSYES
jgi:hypothetical protein